MDLAYELHDLVRTLDREADQILRGQSLSFNRYLALVILAEHPGLTSRQLAGAVGVTEPAMSGIVRRLRDSGLVDDTSAPGSGNVRTLHVTPAGREKATECGRLLGGSLDDVARNLGIDPSALATTIHSLHAALRDAPSNQENSK